MKILPIKSFRFRLFLSLLITSLIPLLLCSTLMLQFFRIRMDNNDSTVADDTMNSVVGTISDLVENCNRSAERIAREPIFSLLLTDAIDSSTTVNRSLFDATADIRGYSEIELFNAAGSLRCSTAGTPVDTILPINWGALKAASESETIAWVGSDAPESESGVLLKGAYAIRSADNTVIGFIVFDFTQNNLLELFDAMIGTRNDLILTDTYFRPIFSTSPLLAEPVASTLRESLMEKGTMPKAEGDFTFTIEREKSAGIVCILRQQPLFTSRTQRIMTGISIICFFICITISVALSLRLSDAMFSPIRSLQKAIAKVEKNDLSAEAQTLSGDEFGQLNASFNDMIHALNQNQQALLQNERDLNEAQIRMLQAQLNPHFLCNTLDTMKWIGKINRVPQIAVMSTNLADILRFCISPEQFVPLSRELEVLERYIEIQEIRLSDRFLFSLEVPSELYDCMVPKMILQPIVENSILHGIADSAAGKITVRAKTDSEGALVLTVEDDGPGYPEHMLGAYHSAPPSTGGHHLGLYNINTIIRKHYGEAYGLTLRNEEGSGAITEGRLPIIREEKHEEASDC